MIRYEPIPCKDTENDMLYDYMACKNSVVLIIACPTLVISPLFNDYRRHDNGP